MHKIHDKQSIQGKWDTHAHTLHSKFKLFHAYSGFIYYMKCTFNINHDLLKTFQYRSSKHTLTYRVECSPQKQISTDSIKLHTLYQILSVRKIK